MLFQFRVGQQVGAGVAQDHGLAGQLLHRYPLRGGLAHEHQAEAVGVIGDFLGELDLGVGS